MMTDVRELIIDRLVGIGNEIPEFGYVARNVVAIDDDQDVTLPAYIVLDGDEGAIDDEPHKRPATVPRRVEMTPLILLAFADKPETLGTDLNTLRALLIKNVLSDGTLRSLVDRFGIRYDGMETPRHESGRLMIGQRFIRFTFTYLLKPDEL